MKTTQTTTNGKARTMTNETFTLTLDTEVTAVRGSKKRFLGCKTVADIKAKMGKHESAAAYNYPAGWQVEVRDVTPAGRVRRLACFTINELS